MNTNTRIALAAASQYGVTPDFVNAYVSYQQFDLDRHRDWDELRASLTPLSLMYVDFAMTCVQRASVAANQICSTLPGNPGGVHRYLDVGCGYGGFVREFARRGFDSVGVELQPHLAEFSRQNCVDLPNATIIEGNLLHLDAATLGAFDVVTCNDVIEHVQDPLLAMQVLAERLRPGGVLFMEIPNRDCIESVRCDGHFQQFGLTLLQRNASAALLEAMAGNSCYLQEMGEMYPLDYYLSALHSVGLKTEVRQVHRVAGISAIPELVEQLIGGFVEWERLARTKVDPHLRTHVADRFSDYMEGFWREYRHALSGTAVDQFELRYLNSFWTVIARLPVP